MTRFDPRPLEATVIGPDEDDVPVTEIARRLRTTARTIHRRRAVGLDERQADELAVAAGMHSSEVWGAAWWAGALDDEGAVA